MRRRNHPTTQKYNTIFPTVQIRSATVKEKTVKGWVYIIIERKSVLMMKQINYSKHIFLPQGPGPGIQNGTPLLMRDRGRQVCGEIPFRFLNRIYFCQQPCMQKREKKSGHPEPKKRPCEYTLSPRKPTKIQSDPLFHTPS